MSIWFLTKKQIWINKNLFLKYRLKSFKKRLGQKPDLFTFYVVRDVDERTFGFLLFVDTSTCSAKNQNLTTEHSQFFRKKNLSTEKPLNYGNSQTEHEDNGPYWPPNSGHLTSI